MEDYEIINCDVLRAKLLDKNELTLFEIGPGAAYKSAHLPRAISVQPDLVRKLVPELVSREAPFDQIVLYDGGSNEEASRAARELVSMGYKNVKIVDGGKRAWTDAGYPMEQSGEAPHEKIA